MRIKSENVLCKPLKYAKAIDNNFTDILKLYYDRILMFFSNFKI